MRRPPYWLIALDLFASGQILGLAAVSDAPWWGRASLVVAGGLGALTTGLLMGIRGERELS